MLLQELLSLPLDVLGVVSQPFEGLRAVGLSNRSNHASVAPRRAASKLALLAEG